MNWLMYIGGGWLWSLLWTVIYQKWDRKYSNTSQAIAMSISVLSSWIYICLRFIK